MVFAFRIQQTGAVRSYRFAAGGAGDAGDGTQITETRRLTRGRTWAIKGFAGSLLGGADAHDAALIDGMQQTLRRIKSAMETAAPR